MKLGSQAIMELSYVIKLGLPHDLSRPVNMQVYAEFKRITAVDLISTFLSAVDERVGGLIYLYCSRAHTPVKTN